jgi:glucose/arabinose dehydrogenase
MASGAVATRSSASTATAPGKPFLGNAAGDAGTAAAAVLPSGFQDLTVFAGLTNPTAVRFSADGRVFVAQKSGVVVEFDNLTDTTPTTVLDLRTETDDYWDRGLLGLALDPAFPANPYIYLLYTYDAPPGRTAPVWNDACPSPPGPTTDGCVVTGKLVRVQLAGNVATGTPTTLVADQWCQQFPSHSVGDLHFGADGKLYVSGGEGANFNATDYGQYGGSTGSPTPKNPCGDPPAGVGGTETPPTAEGGALRSQSPRRASGEPVLLNGAVLRVDPATGAGLADNPFGSSPDANARKIVTYGLRNPFRFTFRPGTNELWIADVGEGSYEEIDRLQNPTASPATNYGWPCYEGAPRNNGYSSANLNLCNSLYSAGTQTAPYYAYAHSAAVVAGETCPVANGSSITGLAFFTGGGYPAAYNNALFFADHTRNCIWAMLPGSNGLPDPTRIQTFVAGAGHPVDLQAGPSGDLFYADLEDGTIHRIVYNSPGGGTCAPGTFDAQYFNNMTLSGSPSLERCEQAVDYSWGTGSPDPAVPQDHFSTRWVGSFDFGTTGTYGFSATADDGIRVYVDGVAVIDQWKDQPATTYSALQNVSAGTHEVRIEYYENAGDAVVRVAWSLQQQGGSCPDGQFAAQYFSNTTLTAPATVARCEASVNYNWGQSSPDPLVPVDHFSARWSGQFSLAAGSYTFTATADDGIRVYVDGIRIIDAFVDQPATTYTASTTLTAGTHSITVEYYENTGDAVARVSWSFAGVNTAPDATVDTPAPSLTYAVGDTISFSGHATDAEDGTIPASGLSWSLIQHHCPSPGSCHTHLVQTWSGISSGSVSAPDHDYPSSLELRLTATDSGGLQASASVELQPKTVDLSFQSSPTGLTLSVDGVGAVTPFTATVIVNSNTSLSAPATQTLGGASYQFSSWSDGGSATHNVIAPGAPATYSAAYVLQGPVNTAAPTLSGSPRVGSTMTTTDGSWTPTPTGIAYQWQRCTSTSTSSCSDIAGATASTYVPGVTDIKLRLRSKVTATNAGGSTSAFSALSSPVRR